MSHQHGSRSSAGQVEIGRLRLTYLRDLSEPETLPGWVLRVDFERLRRTVGAFEVVRKLQALVESDSSIVQVREILDSGGVDVDRAKQQRRRQPSYFELVLYRQRENGTGLTPFRKTSIAAHTVARVNLVDTCMIYA